MSQVILEDKLYSRTQAEADNLFPKPRHMLEFKVVNLCSQFFLTVKSGVWTVTKVEENQYGS